MAQPKASRCPKAIFEQVIGAASVIEASRLCNLLQVASFFDNARVVAVVAALLRDALQEQVFCTRAALTSDFTHGDAHSLRTLPTESPVYQSLCDLPEDQQGYVLHQLSPAHACLLPPALLASYLSCHRTVLAWPDAIGVWCIDSLIPPLLALRGLQELRLKVHLCSLCNSQRWRAEHRKLSRVRLCHVCLAALARLTTAVACLPALRCLDLRLPVATHIPGVCSEIIDSDYGDWVRGEQLGLLDYLPALPSACLPLLGPAAATLREVVLDGTPITVDVVHALRSLPQLRSLALRDNDWHLHAAAALDGWQTALTALRALHCNLHRLHSKQHSLVIAAVAKVAPRLEELSIKAHSLEAVGDLERLAALLSSATALRALNLAGARLREDLETLLAQVLPHTVVSSLHCLSLADSGLRPWLFGKFLADATALRHLDLSCKAAPPVPGDSGPNAAWLAALPGLTALESLALGFCVMGRPSLPDLPKPAALGQLSQLTALLSLRLQHVAPLDAQLNAWHEAEQKGREHLGNGAEAPAKRVLAHALAGALAACTRLTELRLTRCDIGLASLAILCTPIGRLTRLRVLDLSHNPLVSHWAAPTGHRPPDNPDYATPSEHKVFRGLFDQCAALSELHVAGTLLGGSGWRALGGAVAVGAPELAVFCASESQPALVLNLPKVLEGMCKLADLRLARCSGFGDTRGVARMEAVLPALTRLTAIHLPRNHFGASVHRLLASLERLPMLLVVDLSCDDCSRAQDVCKHLQGRRVDARFGYQAVPTLREAEGGYESDGYHGLDLGPDGGVQPLAPGMMPFQPGGAPAADMPEDYEHSVDYDDGDDDDLYHDEEGYGDQEVYDEDEMWDEEFDEEYEDEEYDWEDEQAGEDEGEWGGAPGDAGGPEAGGAPDVINLQEL